MNTDSLRFDQLVGECASCGYNPIALTELTITGLRPIDPPIGTFEVCEVCVSTFASKTLRNDRDGEITMARLIRSMAWMTNCILDNIRDTERA